MEDLHLSFEFFPAKTEAGIKNLLDSQKVLAGFGADLFSVTYGAGGSTRNPTLELVATLIKIGVPVAPHISCIGHTHSEIQTLLDEYMAINVNSLVVLRGDLPSGLGVAQGDFKFAIDLVEFVRATYGDHFEICVAAYPEVHPQAKNYQQDLDAFVCKVKAGANLAMTQFFFNAKSYFYFVEQVQKQQIDIPVIPGIMPIGNFAKLCHFAEMCGSEIPRWMRYRLEGYGEDTASIQAFGIEVMTQLCEDLLANDAPGLHFYTLNSSNLTARILDNLGW